MTSGLLGKELLNGTIALDLAHVDLVTFRLAHDGEVLRQDHQSGLLANRLVDQPFGFQQVGAHVRAGCHLDTGNIRHTFLSSS